MIRFACLISLLFAAPATAQTIPSVGTSDALDVATWNIEHFGNPSSGPSDDDLQLKKVAGFFQLIQNVGFEQR